jgi:hypothetical protein
MRIVIVYRQYLLQAPYGNKFRMEHRHRLSEDGDDYAACFRINGPSVRGVIFL